MKKSALIAAIALISGSVFAFDSDPITPAGNVDSFTKTEYSVASKFGEYFRTVSVKHVHTYTNGLRTMIASYTAKDELVDKTEYTYNDEKQMTFLVSTDAQGKIIKKISYEYLADGRLKSESEFNEENELTAKNIIKYESGKTTESLYNGEGRLISRTVNTIAADGKIIESAFYFGDGSLSHAEKYTYTDSGEFSIIENFDSERNKAGKTVYRYDANNFISEIDIYATDTDLIERDIFKNDEKGNPVRISIYSVAEKFGTTTNELVSISDFAYTEATDNAK